MATTVSGSAAASRSGRLADELATLEDRFAYDVEATLDRAARIEAAAEELGDPALLRRALLVRANMWRRSGQLGAAARVCWDVNAWAAAHGHRPLLSRSHLQLSAVYHILGDAAGGLEHSVAAVGYLDGSTPPRARAVCLMKLGDDLAVGGSIEAARERYHQAEQVAIDAGSVELQLLIMNNLAYAESLAGEVNRSWITIERIREVAATSGQAVNAEGLDTIARILIALGRYAEAEESSRASIAEHESVVGPQDADSMAEHFLTLAVAQRHRGALDAARATLDRSAALCAERDLAAVGVRMLQERAELYAAGGDFAQAFATYKAFHAAEQKLVSAQREAQARARQAMFEATEARQEAQRFREQARRDPLTGLHNRRYVDEELPGLLDRGTRTGSPVTVAILDLDHFKRINDTCSHDVGDQVLVAFANLLGAAVADAATGGTGFAARLGGEEFLVVLPEVSPTTAIATLDELRRAVSAYPWRPLTGDLRVTVSVGVTVAEPGSTQAGMLRRADASLYTAKRDGRNRVIVDPVTPVHGGEDCDGKYSNGYFGPVGVPRGPS
jgi:diguanylate cyclase (GGDEF)-like protein